MECKNGQKYPVSEDIWRQIEWQRVALQLALASSVPFPHSTQAMHTHQCHPPIFPPPMPKTELIQELVPFMNNMEEISYWVATKRAPCLLNYDNVIKRQSEQAHCSKITPKSVQSIEIIPPKNKKRKIKQLNNSVSTEKSQIVYFDKPQTTHEKPDPKGCRSDSLGSKIDFNIKLVREKPKRVKAQKKVKATKKDKLCASTPKVTNLRRSLRNNNNNTQLNGSFELLNTSAIVGEQEQFETKLEGENTINLMENLKNETNGKYNIDSSDVSGFTANYIRSTKVHLSKPTPKIQNKASKSQTKLKKENPIDQDKVVMCVNKSVNTGNVNTVLNCSTDSSQNIINLVTVNHSGPKGVDKTTSLLKFVNVKSDGTHDSEKKGYQQRNTSFQSKDSNSPRYPKRCRKICVVNSEKECYRLDTSEDISSPVNICTPNLRDTERKENSVNYISKTRSGRKIGLNLDAEVPGYNLLNINNSNEQVSSSVTLNVGNQKTNARKKNTQTRCPRNTGNKNRKKNVTKDSSDKELCDGSILQQRSTRSAGRTQTICETGQLSHKDSLRDKSGFTTCFSDSDSDDEPLKRRKFFC